MTGMILIDLHKAFDTIDHDILNFSQPASAPCGVPQGSILGPLLLLIYVNDTSEAVKCDLFLYANDTCLVC